MAYKIKKIVPKGTTKSVATLVCPSGFTDELPSSWYDNSKNLKNLNFSVL